MIPVSKLDTNYLKSQVDINTTAAANAGGEVFAIIGDGNRTNQSLFKNMRHKRGNFGCVLMELISCTISCTC